MTLSIRPVKRTFFPLALAMGLLLPSILPAAAASPAGLWLGTLQGSLRIAFEVNENPDHTYSVLLDSIDQHARGLQTTQVTFEEGRLRFVLPSVHGSYDGLLNPQGTVLKGHWTQDVTSPLDLKRVDSIPKDPPPLTGPGILTAQVMADGSVMVHRDSRYFVGLYPQVFSFDAKSWQYDRFDLCGTDPRFDALAEVPGEGKIGLSASVTVLDSSIHVVYRMTALSDVHVINVRAAAFTPYDLWVGAPYRWGKAKGKVPVERSSNNVIASGDRGHDQVGPAGKDGPTLKWDGPGLHGALQDNRNWTPDLVLTWDHGESTSLPWLWKAGEEKDFDFTLSLDSYFTHLAPTAEAGAKTWMGDWTAKQVNLEFPQRQDRYILKIGPNKRGKPTVTFRNLDEYGGGQEIPLDDVSLKAGELALQIGSVLVKLKMDPDGRGMTGSAKRADQTQLVHFTRGDEFYIPRVDAAGQPVTQYQYREPKDLSDGWRVGDLEKTPLDPKIVAKGMDLALQDRFPNLEGLVVVQKGRLVLDEYFRGFDPGDLHQMQSTSKSVLAILFGIAQDNGLVAARQKLYDYYPEYRTQPGWDKAKGRITLANLLSMSSGFDCDDWIPPGDGCNKGMWKSADWLAYDLNLPLNHDPGTHFAYTTSCMELLGSVIAKKSGLSIPDFAEKYLFQPLGIKSFQYASGPNDVTEVGGSLRLRPRDMAKMGEMYLRMGKWNGRRIVSSRWVEACTRPEAPKEKRTFDYGYLWWQEDMPYKDRKVKVFYAAGLGGQHIFVVPDLDLVCVTTAGNYSDYPLAQQSMEFYKAFILGAYK